MMLVSNESCSITSSSVPIKTPSSNIAEEYKGVGVWPLAAVEVVGVWRVYLVLGQAAADGTGLLGAEVEGEKLLLLVRLPQRRLLLLRDHREHARDRGAHNLAEEPQGTGTIRFDSVQSTTRE